MAKTRRNYDSEDSGEETPFEQTLFGRGRRTREADSEESDQPAQPAQPDQPDQPVTPTPSRRRRGRQPRTPASERVLTGRVGRSGRRNNANGPNQSSKPSRKYRDDSDDEYNGEDSVKDDEEGNIRFEDRAKVRSASQATVHPNGRAVGRQLVMWHRPRMMERLLLSLQYECSQEEIELPWAQAVHRLAPGSSGQAAIQYLTKMRRTLIQEGHLVPPKILKNPNPASAALRGFVRDESKKNPWATRGVTWEEELEDRSVSLKDPGIFPGSGSYRKKENRGNPDDLRHVSEESPTKSKSGRARKTVMKPEERKAQRSKTNHSQAKEESDDDCDPLLRRSLRRRTRPNYKISEDSSDEQIKKPSTPQKSPEVVQEALSSPPGSEVLSEAPGDHPRDHFEENHVLFAPGNEPQIYQHGFGHFNMDDVANFQPDMNPFNNMFQDLPPVGWLRPNHGLPGPMRPFENANNAMFMFNYDGMLAFDNGFGQPLIPEHFHHGPPNAFHGHEANAMVNYDNALDQAELPGGFQHGPDNALQLHEANAMVNLDDVLNQAELPAEFQHGPPNAFQIQEANAMFNYANAFGQGELPEHDHAPIDNGAEDGGLPGDVMDQAGWQMDDAFNNFIDQAAYQENDDEI